MPITFVGSSVGQSSNAGTTVNLSHPAGHQANDVGIIFCVADETGTVPDWSIDGGLWTRLRQDNPTQGRDRVVAIFYRRYTSSSEVNPVARLSITQERSASLHVFRGVDTNEMFDVEEKFASGQNNPNPTNPAITTVSDESCVVLLQAQTHDDILALGLPSSPAGLIQGLAVAGAANDHRSQVVAYLLDAGPAGTITPSAWQHTVSSTGVSEWTVYTLALRLSQPLGVTDVNSDEVVPVNSDNNVATGFGFGAVQGTGKVEIGENSDYTGTIVLQSIDSWSDTSIQFDSVQGGLSEGTVYLFVTNDDGDRRFLKISYGAIPYDQAILRLAPDHWWQLDDSYDDDAGVLTRNMTTDISGTHDFSTIVICEKNTRSWRLNSVTERRGCADSENMNLEAQTARTMGGWVQVDSVQQSLGALYKEGGGVNNLAFILGIGNVLMAQLADTNDDNAQAYGDNKLVVNRPYHVMFRFDYAENPAEFRMFIDGVEQSVTDGNPLTSTDLDSHSGDINWGDPDSNLEMGGTDIAFAGTQGCLYAQWATWTRALDKTSEIRKELFERGALADVTLAQGTEAAMQISLAALANTVRSNWPLAFRIPAPVDSSDLKLVADNINFDPLSSIHVQYTGPGVLTWVNSNGSNASITSTTAGGSIVIVEAVLVRVTLRDISTQEVIPSARVRILADAGGPLAEGELILEGVTDSNGQVTANLEYSSDQPFVGVARKASSSPLYRQGVISGTVFSFGAELTLLMIRDE